MPLHIPGPVGRFLDNVLPASGGAAQDCFCGRAGWPSVEFGEPLCQRDLENARAVGLGHAKGNFAVEHIENQERIEGL
jgi:hypothetical protein